jgi:dolichyl-diphosphooligosaccharide--protein glycosyltransferase
VIALTVRLLPLRWIPAPWYPDHLYLSAFDPYYQYRVTEHIVENGFQSWGWHDAMSWYPWGRDIYRSTYPGLPMTAALFYMILNALAVPIDLAQFCLVFPAIMGAVTCLIAYFVGRDIGGEAVGLFSAFFLALNSSYISRTAVGFYDTETVGILGIMLYILFFLKSIEEERPLKVGVIYAVAAGLSLGYLCASWGASRYPIAMTVLFVFVLLLMRKYTPRLMLSYGLCFALALLISAAVPRLGLGFLKDASIVPVYGVFLLMCVFELNRRVKTQKMRVVGVLTFIISIAVAFSALWAFGYVSMLGGKYISVLNPFEREGTPLIESVAEHRTSTWASFYYDLELLAFFIPIGLFFAYQMSTDKSIFLLVFSLTSIYFASSMIRLTLIMAPAISLVCALGIVRVTRPFAAFLKEETVKIRRRKTRFGGQLGKEFSAGLLILIFLLLAFTYVIGTDFTVGRSTRPRVFSQAYSPTTMAAAGLPIRPGSTVRDWVDTLVWIREQDDVKIVASWWDYGYWITTIGNKTSLADNGTINSTQIRQLAKMFMSPEDEAVEILKNYDATHVLVFSTVDSQGNDYPWGESGKFGWMIKIARLNESKYVTTQNEWTDYGKNTTLYKMMTFGKYAKVPNGQVAQQQYYELFEQWGHFSERFELAYYSRGAAVSGVHSLVLVYKVYY